VSNKNNGKEMERQEQGVISFGVVVVLCVSGVIDYLRLCGVSFFKLKIGRIH
jgi:hypothetical protein